MKFCSLFLISVLTLSGRGAFAQEDPVYTLPVEWQKVELQQRIAADMTKSLQAVVDPSKFLVQVVLQISESKTFEVTEKDKSKGAEAFPLAKLGLDKNSNAYKKAIVTGQNNIFSRIKGVTVDIALDTAVSKTQETQVRAFAEKVAKGYVNAGVGLTVTRMAFVITDDGARARNLEVARMNAEAVKGLGTSVAQALTQGNDKIALALNEGNERVAKAIAATQNIKLDPPKKTVEADPAPVAAKKDAMPQTWQEILVVFQIPIGILVATFLLIFFVSGFKSIENKKVALMAAAGAQAAAVKEVSAVEAKSSSSSEESTSAEASSATVHGIAGMAGGHGGSGAGAGDKGFDQFRKMAEQYPETAAYLIKTWLNIGTAESQEALAALPQMISVDTLVPVISQLDDSLKLKMKKASLETLDAGSFARANGFIIEQMVENFLVNLITLPEELRTLLSGMSMEECVECVQKDLQFGVCFMNVLQTPQVARMLSMLPEEMVGQLFEEGAQFTSEKSQFLEQNLDSALSEIRQRRNRVRAPLMDKSIELIKILGPEKEPKILEMLFNSGDHDLIEEATRRYFPAELIMTLPAEKMRQVLGKLSAKQRAMLIYSRSADEQKTFFAAVGAQGRLREMIDAEMSEIKKDVKVQNQIKKDKTKLWEQFIVSARLSIQADESLKELSNEMLKSWLLKKGVDVNEGIGHQAA